MSLPVTAEVPFEGDYNPEQWPEDVWKQDHRTEPIEVTAPTSGVDLLTGDRAPTGSALRLPAYGVVVLREDG
ncbi:Beta-galactosidase C-terminal domain [Micromonospora zamorensis]|uniref:Beta-galactosidase C-terminal domain n=1 Tax=Micromonospora zamorensis TaxID=709883 RepID=UPI00379002F1